MPGSTPQPHTNIHPPHMVLPLCIGLQGIGKYKQVPQVASLTRVSPFWSLHSGANRWPDLSSSKNHMKHLVSHLMSCLVTHLELELLNLKASLLRLLCHSP